MKLTFLGATQTVTGSKFLIETNDRRILVDCGLFQGLKELRLRNWEDPPVDPRTVDAIVLTHAHIDHTGYLPRFVAHGYKGPIYATSATVDLAGILLPVVQRDQPTTLARVSAGQALAELVRQSPWLLAHRGVAAAGITLLSRAALSPAFALTLGLDTYGDPAHLRALVTTAGSGRPPASRGSVPGLPLEPRAPARPESARLATAP